MSTPNLAGIWYTQGNAKFPATDTVQNINSSAMFMLKEMLKGTSSSGTLSVPTRPSNTFWTVEGSCDSLTGAMDGIDRLTGSVANSFDTTKWVHAASGSAHSWIVLKSPLALGPVWMCIDANSATTTTYGIVFSKQAFTGSIPSGVPTQITSSRPITNMGWAAGNSADPIQTTNSVVMTDQNAGGIYRAHISVDSSGAFNFMVSRDGLGIFTTFISCFNTVDRNANDNVFQTFCMFNSVSSTRGAPAWSTVGTTVANCNGRTLDGTTVHSAGGFVSWQFGGTTFSGTATQDMGYTTNRVLPIYIQTAVVNKMSWRGRVPDLWVVGNAAVGDSFPSRASPTHHVVGDLIVPLQIIPIL